MTVQTVTGKRCARCGKWIPTTRPRIYSRWSRSYYCADITKCEQRAKRATK